MGFFKASQGTASSRVIARLQALIWVLIYGGLLMLVLGLSVRRSSEALGWALVVAGGVVALAGFFLIYVRSRVREEP
jgi:formate hydrogenlyase subunit 3/multisubunit Na+/H+ antiporter MnhD subunit